MLTYKSLVNTLKDKRIYMLTGNGTKNQFNNITKLKQIIKFILADIPKQSCFLYFGDQSNKLKPDIGYAFELIKLLRPDIDIYI